MYDLYPYFLYYASVLVASSVCADFNLISPQAYEYESDLEAMWIEESSNSSPKWPYMNILWQVPRLRIIQLRNIRRKMEERANHHHGQAMVGPFYCAHSFFSVGTHFPCVFHVTACEFVLQILVFTASLPWYVRSFSIKNPYFTSLVLIREFGRRGSEIKHNLRAWRRIKRSSFRCLNKQFLTSLFYQSSLVSFYLEMLSLLISIMHA